MKYRCIHLISFLAMSNIIGAQDFTEILGRPTDSSITMSIRFEQAAEVYWEYGTTPGNYAKTTATHVALANLPIEVDFRNLLANNRYYYRTRYRLAGASTPFLNGVEHGFYTQRAKSAAFSFVVEADPHLDSNTNPAAYRFTLQHMLSKKPDFLVDLGDNFMSEKLPTGVATAADITNRHVLFRSYFNEVCHSAPLYLALGNHEGELGWLPNTSAASLPAMATNTRKLYYPNPFPNSFYSGDTIPETHVGLRENYYAWEWGNALFIVIDPYWYSKTKPGWGWTLGASQYNWFKNTITKSTASFKFVFSHQLVGGNGNDARGGSEFAGLFEMGGYNLDGSYGFDTYRPGWQKPIHTLMKENGGNIFFHGHDHFFARQDKDNVVYQEVPQPSAKNILNITGTEPGYGYVNGLLLSNRGYLLVTVAGDSVKVDYVKTYLPAEENATRHNGDIAYSYTIRKSNGSTVINNQELVKIYPNPSKNSLHVDLLDHPAHYQIRLLNTGGQVLLQTVKNDINVSRIPAGIYVLNIETDEYRINKRVVVTH